MFDDTPLTKTGKPKTEQSRQTKTNDMKNLFALTVALIISNLLFGQTTNWEEVVYLKNGSVIRGTIIEQVPNKTIKIQTKDRNIFVYNMDEVEKIAKEEIKQETEATKSSDKKFDNASVKESGFSNITEIGGIFGVGNSVQTNPNTDDIRFTNKTNLFSLTTINGYQINRHGFIGLGMGTEVGKYAINVPLFLDGRYYILKKRVTPFLAFGAGYALTWLRMSTQVNFTKGGALAYSLAGVRIYISKNVSWVMGLGYRFQHGYSTITYTDYNGQELGQFTVQKYSHFLALRTGLTF